MTSSRSLSTPFQAFLPHEKLGEWLIEPCPAARNAHARAFLSHEGSLLSGNPLEKDVACLLLFLSFRGIIAMREILTLHSIPKALSFLLALVGLGLIFMGVVGNSYWSGFGLVIFMTGLMLVVSLKPQPH